MKKTVRLTETDLIRLVKNVIKESSPNDYNVPNSSVKKVINALKNLGWIKKNTTNIYKDYFEIYSIPGKRFDYFGMGNYLKIEVEDVDDDINLFVFGEDYGEEDDIENKKIVMDYIDENWFEPLTAEGIYIFTEEEDDDEY